MQTPARRIDLTELCAALALIALGAYALYTALGYNFGTLRRMGSGFVPTALSVVLIFLGGLLALSALKKPSAQGPTRLDIQLRPTVLVLGSMLMWALLVQRIGFVPATFLLVCLCSMAERGTRLVPTLICASAICLFGYVVFLYGLNVPLPVFGAR